MKTITRVLSAAGMLLLTAILLAAAKNMPMLFVSWYPAATQKLQNILAGITGVFPFPLWEVIAVLLLAWLVVSFIKSLPHMKVLRWLSGILWGVSLGALLLTALWGINHFLPRKTDAIVRVREADAASLYAAGEYYGRQASALAAQFPRDSEGQPMADFPPEAAAEGFHILRERGFDLPEATLKTKTLFAGKLFNYMGITGMFVPYTAEASINPAAYPPSQPFVACHELAHRQGAAAEEDADFLAFLAASVNEDVRYRYSAYYSAFLYCYNALQTLSPEQAAALWNTVSSQVQDDLRGSGAYYAVYEGAVQDAAKKVNDTYLKTFNETEGVHSYDLVSNALVAWYDQKIAT